MLVSQIHEFAKSCPNRTAVIRNGVPFSYFAFSNLIQFMIGWLEQKKLPPGKIAVMPATDPLAEWVMVLSMRYLGLNTLVVNSLEQAAQLELKDCACVVTPEVYQVTPDDIAKFPAGVEFITICNRYFQNPPKTLLPVQPPLYPFGGHILLTSGTTGAHKKVLIEGQHEAARNLMRAKLHSFTPDTVWQGAGFGLWTAVGFRHPPAVWSCGGCVVLDRRADWCTHFLSHGVNAATLIPQMLKELLESSDSSALPANGLKLNVGAGFLPAELAEKATHKLTNNLWVQCGSTEVEGLILRSQYKSTADLFWLEPVQDERLQIVDENGDACALGQEGQLRIVLSKIDSKSYLDDEETSAQFFRNGCFYPGDMAIRREDGRIRILGRTADVINIQGSKTAVAPIEQWIQQLLGVDEVCVFSGLSDKGSDLLIIAVEARKEISQSDLEIVGGKFSRFTKVRVVTLGDFPRTEGGMRKVNRRALRNLIIGEIGRRSL